MLATKITSSLASLLKIYGMWRTQRAYSGVGCLLENLLQLGQYHGWLLGFMGLEAPFLVYFFLMCLTWNSQWFWARSVCFHLLLVHTRYVLRRQTYGLKDKCTYKKPSMKDAVCSSYELVPALWVSRKYQRAKWLSSGRSIWRCVIFLRRIKPVSIHLSHSTNEEIGGLRSSLWTRDFIRLTQRSSLWQSCIPPTNSTQLHFSLSSNCLLFLQSWPLARAL